MALCGYAWDFAVVKGMDKICVVFAQYTKQFNAVGSKKREWSLKNKHTGAEDRAYIINKKVWSLDEDPMIGHSILYWGYNCMYVHNPLGLKDKPVSRVQKHRQISDVCLGNEHYVPLVQSIDD